MKSKFYYSIFFWILILPYYAQAQVDHWETAVFAEDIWSYRLGDTEPPANWMQPAFNDASWNTGPGGFGYGDDDDNTVIPTTLSIYLRIDFNIVDIAALDQVILHADYDDAFVAYLNGVEIARGNFPANSPTPTHDQIPPTDHEAALYNGGLPESFWLPSDEIPTLLQEGQNTLAIQVHNFLITSSDLSSNFFLTFGINDNSTSYEPPPAWFMPPLEFTNLPLVRISTNGQAIEPDYRIVADMKVVDNGPGNLNYFSDPATGYEGKIAIEIRGASSQSFPKKNYGFETQDEAGENNNYPLLGMPEENDWILHGPFSDKSMIRNALSFDIGRNMMPYASRTRFCELVINQDYRGIYLLMEKIKRDSARVNISKLTPADIEGDELTGGYIFQLDRDNPNIEEDGWYSSYGSSPFYAYHHPNYDDLLPVQRNYLRNWMNDFESAMTATNFAQTYDDYIDIESFVDYFLINELTKHVDAFKLSFYMYKRKDSNGGKLYMGPIWDFNLGFSNFDFECDPEPQGWIFPCTSRAFWLDKILMIPEVRNRIHCRWETLRQSSLATSALLGRIDEMVDELAPALDANFSRWNVLGEYVWPNYYVGDNYAAEISFMKGWLADRLVWMDQFMLGEPLNCTTYSPVVPAQKPELDIQPNPFSAFTSFTLRSGDTAGATLSIYDGLGRQVDQLELQPDRTVTWQAEHLSAGVYFYRLQAQDAQHSGSFVIL